MPELDPSSDFRDDGGTPAWRANRATYVRYQQRGLARLRWKTIIGWFFLYPLFALPCFYIGSFLLAFWGVPVIWAMVIVGVFLIGPPIDRIKRGSGQSGMRR